MHCQVLYSALWIFLGLISFRTSEASTATTLSAAFRDVVRTVEPSVVHLDVEKGPRRTLELIELQEAFGLAKPFTSDDATRDASGSGAIISADGHIVTNFHVVEGAINVTAVLSNQRRYPVRVLGVDPRTDLAVLKLDTDEKLPFIRLGNSDALSVGDVVMAVGSPFEFQSTFTVGIVSARGRRGLSDREIQDYIQTDAAINPGNSGGPLINMNGRIVGINTAIFSPEADQNSGISFSIPSNMAQRVVADLLDQGIVRRNWLGLVAKSVNTVEGDPSRRGAEILKVFSESPAEKAGFRRGDVITHVDHDAIRGVKELRSILLARPLGAKLKYKVQRDEITITVTAASIQEDEAGDRSELAGVSIGQRSGVVLVSDNEESLERLGVPDALGVWVASVGQHGAAEKLGFYPGDRIVQVNGAAVDSLDQFRQEFNKGPKWAIVTYERGGITHRSFLPRDASSPESEPAHDSPH